MAYMHHDCFGTIGGSPATKTGRDVASVLTALERQVIAFAAREPLSSLVTARRPIARALFGVVPARALADPRLEALRRFVILYRHDHRGAESSGQALIGTGFPPMLLDDLRATILVDRSDALPALIGVAAIVTVITAVVALVASYINEWVPAIAIGLTACLPLIASLHRVTVPQLRPVVGPDHQSSVIRGSLSCRHHVRTIRSPSR